MRELVLIAAVSRNGVIGAGGKLPWHLPDDLKRFKALTLDHAIIMGRKTYESIGRPLPRRRNLVVSRRPDFAPPGVEVFRDLESALEAAYQGGDPSPFIVGGAELYEQALPLATRLELTQVHDTVDGDVYFPIYDPLAWELVAHEEHDGFAFASYVRKPA